MAATPQLHVLGTADDVQREMCNKLVDYSKECISDHSYFTIGLSGGSVAKYICNGLKHRTDIDWSKWHVFFCDERLVPFDNEESTYALYKRELFDVVNVPASNVFAINPSLDVGGAAQDYITKIRQIYPDTVPSFDMLVLGMGPDGHTCSLFPGHPGLNEKKELVIPISDSPKPPPQRITLTLPVLNAARNVFVVATGSGKADAVKNSLEPVGEPLPVGLVRPTNGELHWYMDTGAADKLTNK